MAGAGPAGWLRNKGVTMFRHLLAAAAALTAVPASAASASAPGKPAATSPEAKKTPSRPAPDPAEVMAFMNKFFDKLLPAGPEPEPARLAAAREATALMFPKGAYAQAMSGFVDRMADHVLSMSEADLAELAPAAVTAKDAKAKSPSRVTLREALAAKEPHFEAKLTAGKAVASLMFAKVGDVMEPKFREGMARSLARRFDAGQMAEIQAFLKTPTGAAYGKQMVGLWFEPDVMRGTFQAMPELMKMMPELMKDAGLVDPKVKDAAKPPAAAAK
jgi:hypothetical protein